MARRDELLISRSRTFRSRRAFAANSFICWSLFWACGISVGLCGIDMLPAVSFSAVTLSVVAYSGHASELALEVASVETDAGGSGRRRLRRLTGFESSELTLFDLA